MNQDVSRAVVQPIVFVDDAKTLGGAQIALGCAIRALLLHSPGEEVVCICSPLARKAILQSTGALEGLRFIDCPSALPLNIFAFPFRLWSFYRLLVPIMRQGVRVWWFNLADIESCLAPLVILGLRGVRPLGWLHNGETSLFFNARTSLPRRILCRVRDAVANRYIFCRYRKVITPSRSSEDSLKSRFDCSHPPRTGFLYPISRIGSGRAVSCEDALSPRSIRLWMIGRLAYGHKNNLAGLDVLKVLQEDEKGASLTVVLDRRNIEDFKNTVKGSGLADSVCLRNWEVDPWRSVPSDAIVLIPSFYESFCLVAREAMYHGIKMVVSPIPVFFEWIPNELIARDFSAKTFAEKVKAVAAMTRDQIMALYEPMLEKLTEEAFVAKFLSLLQEESRQIV
jgi:glycosyltransferase involved in cell wall biosynthesis